MKAIHRPLKKFPRKASHTPKAMKRKPTKRPVSAAIRVALRKLRETPHTIARKTRPPSNGNPGMRLKRASMALMRARYLAAASSGLIGVSKGCMRSEERRVGKECRYRWGRDHEKK